MKLTFLGTGAATAVPLPFCKCRACAEARTLGGRNFRRRSSVVVDDELLIDLGSDSVAACAAYGVDLTRVRYVLQTHAHSDHFDAGHLITRNPEYMPENMETLTLAASEGTLRTIDDMLRREDGKAALFEEEYQSKLKLRLARMEHARAVRLGEYTVTAFRSLHDARQQSMIYLIERGGSTALYAVDICGQPWEALCAVAGTPLNALIIDRTYGECEGSGGHPNADKIADVVRRLRAAGSLNADSRVYATHISHEGYMEHERARASALINGYDIAYDGLVIDI